jgi:hypothetical protein
MLVSTIFLLYEPFIRWAMHSFAFEHAFSERPSTKTPDFSSSRIVKFLLDLSSY